jgi:hypothetical protein
MARHREVTYDYTFEEQAKLLEPNARRLDEIIRSVEWKIANHAEKCPKMAGTILRIAFTDPFPNAPAMRVLFSIKDDDHCVAHWIEYLEPGMDDDLEDDITEEDIPF